MHSGVWRGGLLSSVFKSTYCSNRVLRFGSQQLRGGSQLPLTPGPGALLPSSGLYELLYTVHTQTS